MLNTQEAQARNIQVHQMKATKLYDELYMGNGLRTPMHIAGGLLLSIPQPVKVTSPQPKIKPRVKRVGGKAVGVKSCNARSAWPTMPTEQ